MQWKTPLRLTSMTRCQSANVMSRNRLNPSRPAALTSTVTGPSCARIAPRAASTWARSVTSAAWASSSSSGGFKSIVATWYPSARSRSATARPIPDPPPVTTAFFTTRSHPLERISLPILRTLLSASSSAQPADETLSNTLSRTSGIVSAGALDLLNLVEFSERECKIRRRRESSYPILRGGWMPPQDTATTITGHPNPKDPTAASDQAPDRRLLIDGRLVATGKTFPSLNPATGAVVGHAPEAGVAEAQAAVAAARRAFDTTDWPTDTHLRVRCLEQLHRALVDHREELADLTIAEVGATRALTHGAQLDQPIEIVRYYAELLKTYPLTEDLGNISSRGMQHHRWVEKEAAGVVAAIIAYNYPTQLALAKLGPALAAGCTVVLKGAPDTPLVTLALGELIADHTDIPAGVVNVLSSSDPAVGAALTTSPD